METCNNCKYCYIDELKDRICVNGDSEYCSDYVDRKHSCTDWEGKIKDE